VGLSSLRDVDRGTGGGPHNRQGHPGDRVAGSGADRQVRGSLATVPSREDLARAGYAIVRSTLADWVGLAVWSCSPWSMRCAQSY